MKFESLKLRPDLPGNNELTEPVMTQFTDAYAIQQQ